jgi:hypothetical protein
MQETGRRHQIAEKSTVLFLPFEDPEKGENEEVEDLLCVRCEFDDPHVPCRKTNQHVLPDVTPTVIHHEHGVVFFDSSPGTYSRSMTNECGLDIFGERFALKYGF